MARKKLKLYVWDGVLTDYTDGVAYALARSPEEAKELLMKAGIRDQYWNGLKLDGQDYQEYDGPVAGFVYGGG